ncbi:MAG: AAA family ATPase, partial [Acidobacteria bacterium]|nr:AAA family ATPase [Acidobacteriota bacterium]
RTGRSRPRQPAKIIVVDHLSSYVTTLCENIERNLHILCTAEEREAIAVSTVHKEALALVRKVHPRMFPATEADVRECVETLRLRHAPEYDAGFVRGEWDNVVRLQGIGRWEEYRSAQRTGRGRGLGIKERRRLWQVFGGTLDNFEGRDLLDWSGLCQRGLELLTDGSVRSPYTAVVVDEVQDLTPPELRFLKALCSVQPGNLLLCGDTGQRIYPGGFSLRTLGIEVRGRASVLRINYRTTEQIRRCADRILGAVTDDMDGGDEQRAGTRSLLRGPEPRFAGHPTREDEITAAVATVRAWVADGLAPEAVGIFARTNKRLDDLCEAFDKTGVSWHRLSDRDAAGEGKVHLGTMHRAKGLEFKAVLVLGCGDAEVPSRAALRSADDPQDREAAEARERRLLYVAITRARDEVAVFWTGTPSRFLDPLIGTKETGA